MSKPRPSLLLRIDEQRNILERHLAHVQGVFQASGWSVVRNPEGEIDASGPITAVMTDPWLEPLPKAVTALAEATGTERPCWRTPLITGAEPPQQWQPSNGPYTLHDYRRETLRGRPRAEFPTNELSCSLVAAPAGDAASLATSGWPPSQQQLALVRQVRMFRYDDPAGHARSELLAHIPGETSLIVDIGCGSGRLGELLKQSGHQVIGIEPDPSLAARAAPRLDEVKVMDAETGLAHLSDMADVVILADVLEHTDDPERVLTSVASCLAPAGRVIISLPNSAWLPVLSGLARGRWDAALAGVQARDHLRPMTPMSFRALAAECGLLVHQEVPMIAPLSLRSRAVARILSLFGAPYRDLITTQWIAILGHP